MLIIGITGQFASGKSTVAKILSRKLNAEIIDADKIGHTVLLDKKVKKRLIDYFGAADRCTLAEKAFASPRNHKALCRITHPLLVRKIKMRLKAVNAKNPGSIVIIDAAVLIEMGLLKYVDKLVLVKANRKAQIMRAKLKWNLSESDIKRRIRLQIPFSRLAKKAGFIIDNSMDIAETKKQIDEIVPVIARSSERSEERRSNLRTEIASVAPSGLPRNDERGRRQYGGK